MGEQKVGLYSIDKGTRKNKQYQQRVSGGSAEGSNPIGRVCIRRIGGRRIYEPWEIIGDRFDIGSDKQWVG